MGDLHSHCEPFPERKDLSGAHHLEKAHTNKPTGKNGISTSPQLEDKKTAVSILVLAALSIAVAL